MFENWLALLGVDNYLSETVAEHSVIPILGDMDPETVKVAKTVYHVLCLHLGGRALATVRLAELFNGIEAWRCLVREFESRASADRQAAMLAGLLAPVWHDLRCTLELEQGIQRWELWRQSGGMLLKAFTTCFV